MITCAQLHTFLGGELPWTKDSLLLPAVAESLVAGVLSTDSPIVPEPALFEVPGGDGSDDDSLLVPPVVADSFLEVIWSEVEELTVVALSY